jgi:alpha-D-ribose 1-methylphosphonate 5-triphosphate synthase subunit PhnG
VTTDHVLTRADWLSLLAKSARTTIDAMLPSAPKLASFVPLRGPELGLVMVRGRQGGGGAAFNLGELTIARCTVRDAAGRVGHGYVAGRDLALAEMIARLDAALQDEATRPLWLEALLIPLERAEAQRRTALAAKAAATEVEFFTLATSRGDAE